MLPETHYEFQVFQYASSILDNNKLCMYVALFHSGLDANGVTVGKELLDFLMHSAFHLQRVVGTDIGFRVMQDVIPENGQQTSQRHVNRHGASLISLNDQQIHHDVCWVSILSIELCCQVYSSAKSTTIRVTRRSEN